MAYSVWPRVSFPWGSIINSGFVLVGSIFYANEEWENRLAFAQANGSEFVSEQASEQAHGCIGRVRLTERRFRMKISRSLRPD